MTRIEINSGKLNLAPELLGEVISSLTDYGDKLLSLQNQCLNIRKSVCDLQDVEEILKASIKEQKDAIESFKGLGSECKDFIKNAAKTDEKVEAKIEEAFKEFYADNPHLKPDCEKNVFEHIGDGLSSVAEWCAKHWQEILISVVIVVGAVLAIAAVVCTGGLALAPMIAGALTFFGVASTTALTVATVASVTIATIAVISTMGSSTLDLIGTWCDMSGNQAFLDWQTALNVTSMISNGFYSVGNIYNAVKGVSGKELIARNKAIENGKKGYSNLDAKHPNMKHRAGAEYDRARKNAIYAENMERNGGVIRSDKTGKILERPPKDTTGVTPKPNHANVDHVEPKSLGGENSFSNAQVIERSANSAKSDSANFSDYLGNSIPDVGGWTNELGFSTGGSIGSGFGSLR